MERDSKQQARWHHISSMSTEDSKMPLTSVLDAGAKEESIAERLTSVRSQGGRCEWLSELGTKHSVVPLEDSFMLVRKAVLVDI